MANIGLPGGGGNNLFGGPNGGPNGGGMGQLGGGQIGGLPNGNLLGGMGNHGGYRGGGPHVPILGGGATAGGPGGIQGRSLGGGSQASGGGTALSGFEPGSNEWWNYVLQNQGSTSGDPDWKQNIKDYNAYTGLDVGGRYQGYNAAKMLLPGEYANLAQQLGFYNSLTDDEHAAVMDYLNMMQHPEQMSGEFRDQQTGNAQNQSPLLQNQLLAAGAGQGAKEGAALSLFNNAQRNANSFDASLYSPTGRAQRAGGIMGLIEAQRPNYNNLAQLHGIQLGTPRNQSGAQAIGGLVGQGIGLFTGGGIPGMGGGMAGIPGNGTIMGSGR